MRPEPKFRVGEAVMVRSINHIDENRDFAIVVERIYEEMPVDSIDGYSETAWSYKLHNDIDRNYWGESALRPLPPEKGTTWDECVWQPKEVAA
jgi:hypothetical protein